MPQGRAGSLESLRRLNRLLVVRALRGEGQISRAEIARRTGLSRSTVSSLVADLQADGLVVERPEPGSAYGAQGGRPPILLSFDASAGAAVGIDFGHSHLRVAVSDLASTILAERSTSPAGSPGAAAAWPASSATCSSTPTGSSAAAATAAAWRPSRPRVRSSTGSAAPTATT